MPVPGGWSVDLGVAPVILAGVTIRAQVARTAHLALSRSQVRPEDQGEHW